MIETKAMYGTQESYENDLIRFASESTGTAPLLAGVLLALAAPVPFFIVLKCNDYHCDNMAYLSGTLSILLLIAAIICFITFKNIRSQQTKFQEERIFLRDLILAMQLAEDVQPEVLIEEGAADTGKTSETNRKHLAIRNKMKEQIIQTLLNRYPN